MFYLKLDELSSVCFLSGVSAVVVIAWCHPVRTPIYHSFAIEPTSSLSSLPLKDLSFNY